MRQVTFLLVALVLLGGLFALLAPVPRHPAPVPTATPASRTPDGSEIAERQTPETVARTSTNESGASQSSRYALDIGEDGLISGPSVIRARQGGTLELDIRSSIDDELHVHGYDRELQLMKGQATVLHLPLDLAGRFTIELHHRDIEVCALEVRP